MSNTISRKLLNPRLSNSTLRPVMLGSALLVFAVFGFFILNTRMINNASSATPVTSYWVWRSSDMRLVPEDAALVLYQGNIDTNWQYHPLGIRPVSLKQHNVRLLLRIYTLGPVQDIAELYQQLKTEWARDGVTVNGLEIDFDCASSQLSDYAIWLGQLKPLVSDKLSVTSLMTYIYDNPEELKKVSNNVDHIAMQLYADYKANPQFESVPNWLRKHKIHHTLGITNSSDFLHTDKLCTQWCQGIQIFLNRKEPL